MDIQHARSKLMVCCFPHPFHLIYGSFMFFGSQKMHAYTKVPLSVYFWSQMNILPGFHIEAKLTLWVCAHITMHCLNTSSTNFHQIHTVEGQLKHRHVPLLATGCFRHTYMNSTIQCFKYMHIMYCYVCFSYPNYLCLNTSLFESMSFYNIALSLKLVNTLKFASNHPLSLSCL